MPRKKIALYVEGQTEQILLNHYLEEIKAPSNVLERIGNTAGKKDPKSFREVTSFVSNITNSQIEKVYEDKKIPNFNKFWDKLILLSKFN